MTRSGQPDEAADRRLLAAIQGFVAGCDDPAVAPFAAAIAAAGETWTGVAPAHLPAADLLARLADLTDETTRRFLNAFRTDADSRYWQRTYNEADAVVGANYLRGYGFAEVIGPSGPIVSDRARAGLGIWDAGLTYPAHHHRAEEVYLVLAGGAEFFLADGERWQCRPCGPGESVFVAGGRRHGFRTGARPMALFYAWQGGDLREKSTFDR